MEDRTPFKLNEAIAGWREELRRSPAFLQENLDELEVHLRDSADKLMAVGLSAEEAFRVAIARLGQNRLLEQEFHKTNWAHIWLVRALWMLAGIQLWSLINSVLCGSELVLFLVPNGVLGNVSSVILGIVIRCLALVGLVLIGRWLFLHQGERRAAQWRRVVFDHPAWIALGLVTLGFLASFWPTLLSVLITRKQSPAELGDAAMARAYLYVSWAVLQVFAFSIGLVWLARRQYAPESK
jgi:hypothetical protein